MPILSSELRNQLARVVIAAREAAEAGARSALQALAVHHYEPYGPMTPEQRTLRNRLRAHGRLLGDKRDPNRGIQEIDRLVHECAYQHWHRMLFARFLAENDLLIEPNSGVAITLTECEELARERGENPWVMASRFAQQMLPQIFRGDDPVLEVMLPPETQQTLERLLGELPSTVFTADDSLGWTYQFWQSAEKERVNKSSEKITGRTLPAVTQLFTEHYMVLFLLHNTIGAWHAGKVIANRPELIHSALSEQELRDAVALKGYSFDYLRFVRELVYDDEAKGPWRPAAGTFDAWPRQAKDLKVLDPCCGSGHFLVAAFDLLVRLRMAEEDLSLEDAIRAVLAENLFGLELDTRCTQIAAFNLALTAWKMVGRIIDLPVLNIACSGLSVGVSKSEWLKLAGDDNSLRYGMERLYDLFEQAPELGSLIDPRRMFPEGEMFSALFTELQPLLKQALRRDEVNTSDEQHEIGVTAQGIAKAAELLSYEYTLVITNVPYLGRGSQSSLLKAFADSHFKDSRQDLATIFMDRSLGFLSSGGTIACVTPQNWLFLKRYKTFRECLLRHLTWNIVARLGTDAFETISGEVVNVALVIISNNCKLKNTVLKVPQDWLIAGIDVSSQYGQRHIYTDEKALLLKGVVVNTRTLQKSRALKEQNNSQTLVDNEENNSVEPVSDQVPDGQIRLIRQIDQLRNPAYIITLEARHNLPLLGDYAIVRGGITTGDSLYFRRCFWEIIPDGKKWAFQQSTVDSIVPFGGRHYCLLWEYGEGELSFRAHGLGATIAGREVWEHDGVAISYTGNCCASIYTGELFENVICVCVPRNRSDLATVWSFCESPEFSKSVRSMNQKLSVDVRYFEKVPFDVQHWRRIASIRYPNGLPEPQSDNPTQWLFHGHPAKAEAHTILHVAVARLLGYQWPAEQDANMRLASEAREWVNRCRELNQFADTDGIVCLSPVRGESSAAERLRQLLAAAFGNDWSKAKERQLLQAATSNGSPSSSLEEWLRDKFFEEHCKLFHHRPFVWHIWDGRKDGFHALVNYHRLAGPNGEGRRTLETLTYSYLGDWIERQKAEQREDKEGADARLAAALDLQEQLKKILEGEPPYDIFVRWKPLHEQPIGWDPDINDGVRLNIRPFMSAKLKRGGRAGAGVLRYKPYINWKKDRGKEPVNLRTKDDFPWFWGCDPERYPEHRTNFMGGQNFDGNRWNDLHYSIAVKQAARERSTKGAMS